MLALLHRLLIDILGLLPAHAFLGPALFPLHIGALAKQRVQQRDAHAQRGNVLHRARVEEGDLSPSLAPTRPTDSTLVLLLFVARAVGFERKKNRSVVLIDRPEPRNPVQEMRSLWTLRSPLFPYP